MDVSRIEAAPTKLIDWRRCTAKEIIKYNNEGVDVPPQYLKWAIDFRQDLEKNDKDNTTYEMAERQKVQESRKEEAIPENTANNEQSTAVTDAESETIPEGTAPAEDVNNKTPAEKKREELQNAGVSLRKQAKSFIKDSKTANSEDIIAEMSIKDTEKKSVSEIEALEGEMTALIARAESTQSQLKTEIDNINSGNSNRLTFAKINRLQQKLQQYGQAGQTKLAVSEGDFNTFDSIINSKENIILNAADFGTETSGVGHELINSVNNNWLFHMYDLVVGMKAVNTGNKTTANAIKTDEYKNEAEQINNGNKSQITGLKNKVEDITGVEGFSISNDKETTTEDKKKIEEQISTETETDKAASASLDKILLAKLRKGQDVQA